MKRRWVAGALAGVVAGVTLLGAGAASADPGVWALARDPALARRTRILAEAEGFLGLYERLTNLRREASVRDALVQARRLFEEAGGAAIPELRTRLRYSAVLERLGDYAANASLLEKLVHAQPPPAAPFLADAYGKLAICYAKLQRPSDEIQAYEEALRVEPDVRHRSQLEANRAEARMVLGDIAGAVSGYRAALAALAAPMMPEYGTTTLWGLGVALDRSGDLDGGLESIRLARQYDPRDTSIRSASWFYAIDYDESWYWALASWSAARGAELAALRAEEYEQAVNRWQDYLARAPATDLWVPLARARLRQCEQERDAAMRRWRAAPRGRERPAPRAAVPPARPAPPSPPGSGAAPARAPARTRRP